MQRQGHGSFRFRILLAVVPAMLLLGLVAHGIAQAIMDATTECLIQFRGVPTGDENGGTISCTDCDPTCDSDGVTTPNKKCTFQLQVCLNQAEGACTAGDLKKKVKVKATGCKVTGLRPTPAGMSPACGASAGITVKTKKHGKKAGKCTITAMAAAKGSPKRVDKDVLHLTCSPQQAGSCPTTTTTTTSSTTTTMAVVCGDGVVAGNEACDPPCQQSTCPAGMVCNSACSGCLTPGTCSCGATAPTLLKFTTGMGSGSCGSVTPARCVLGSNATMPCTTDGDCPGGHCVGDLKCSGLYFGGGGVALVLPNTVPDMGTSLLKVGCCEQDGVTMQLVATTSADAGVDLRTCTASTVDNGIYADQQGNRLPGCLFGPPLPIPNLNAAALSTCVINRVATNAAGSAKCTTGDSSVDIPLTSDIYLTGDLLDGTAADRPDVPGIQPCPLCQQQARGGCTPSGGNGCCFGGPKDGMACTPGDSASGDPYPTSHDCPPPAAALIGKLPIPFSLTTDSTAPAAHKTATDMNSQHVFCGFCGVELGTSFGVCVGGSNDGMACQDVGQCSPDGTCTGPFACTSAADCTGHGPLTVCKQRTGGAFGNGGATIISETGVPGGDSTDHLPHASTLVSVFCIPATFTGAVDSAADLPGPGAVALPGEAQLLP